MAGKDIKSVKKPIISLCGSWLIILFISCQSVPSVPNPFTEDINHLPLDKGALVYLFINVPEARPLLELLPIEELKTTQVRQMIDRTNIAMVAFFPEESNRRFQITSRGNYPKSGADMMLSLNKDWKKQRYAINNTYWHSGKDKLSIAMTTRQAYIAAWTNDTPADPFAAAPGIEIPDGFNDFRKGTGAFLSCWVENPGPVFSQALEKAGVPIRFPVQQLFVNVNSAADKKYEATIRLQFENAIHARGVSAILSLAGAFSSDDPIAKLFLSNPPVLNGRNLDIKTAALSESDILQILKIVRGFSRINADSYTKLILICENPR